MKLSVGWLIGGFVWCIFMGITFVSIGLGAAFPPLNYIAKPFVCPNGQMTFNESTSNPLPGTTYTQIGWYCIDQQTQQSNEIDIFPIALAAGPIYGVVMAVIILGIVLLAQRRQPVTAPQTFSRPRPHPAASPDFSHFNTAAPQAADPKDHAARLKELNDLRSQNLISADEYHQKRDEILKDV